MCRALSFTLLVFIAIFLSACNKEVSVDNSVPPAGVKGILKAKIDGQQWIANKYAEAYMLQGLISISGISVDKKLLSIVMPDNGEAVYTLNDRSMNAAAYTDSSLANKNAFTTNQGSAGGTVTITKIDTDKKTLTGTFQFIVSRIEDNQKRTLTEGSFTDIPYTTSLPPTPGGNSLTAKIDGTAWTGPVVNATSTSAQIGSQIFITATDNSISKSIGLIFPNDITPGIYDFDLFGFMYIGQYNPDNDPSHSKASFSGKLEILEHNRSSKKIRGKFSFHAEELLNSANSAEITEGNFSVTYN